MADDANASTVAVQCHGAAPMARADAHRNSQMCLHSPVHLIQTRLCSVLRSKGPCGPVVVDGQTLPCNGKCVLDAAGDWYIISCLCASCDGTAGPTMAMHGREAQAGAAH